MEEQYSALFFSSMKLPVNIIFFSCNLMNQMNSAVTFYVVGKSGHQLSREMLVMPSGIFDW